MSISDDPIGFICFVGMCAISILAAVYFLDTEDAQSDDFQDGIEIGKQMILEATEGEPGYCESKGPANNGEK